MKTTYAMMAIAASLDPVSATVRHACKRAYPDDYANLQLYSSRESI